MCVHRTRVRCWVRRSKRCEPSFCCAASVFVSKLCAPPVYLDAESERGRYGREYGVGECLCGDCERVCE